MLGNKTGYFPKKVDIGKINWTFMVKKVDIGRQNWTFVVEKQIIKNIKFIYNIF